jgi:cytochrome c556
LQGIGLGALAIGLIAAALFFVGGREPKAGAVAQGALAPQASTSLQDIMLSLIDPAADEVWESVSEEWDKDGYRERKPVTGEDWQAVRKRAVVLLEAANLLLAPDRAVADTGKKLDDDGVAGILDAAGVANAIAADRQGYESFSVALRETAREIVAAADAKSVTTLRVLGERLDAVCEACHVRFWYPEAQKPPVAALRQKSRADALLRLMQDKIVPASSAVFEAAAEAPADELAWARVEKAVAILAATTPELVRTPPGLAPTPWREDATAYTVAVAETREAVARRNAAALETANDALYQSCEACHLAYPPQQRGNGSIAISPAAFD